MGKLCRSGGQDEAQATGGRGRRPLMCGHQRKRDFCDFA